MTRHQFLWGYISRNIFSLFLCAEIVLCALMMLVLCQNIFFVICLYCSVLWHSSLGDRKGIWLNWSCSISWSHQPLQHRELNGQPTGWLLLIYSFKFGSAFSHGWLVPFMPKGSLSDRMATNLGYSRISLNMETSGNSVRENWLCALGAACVKQSICSQVYLMHENCWFEQYGTTRSC